MSLRRLLPLLTLLALLSAPFGRIAAADAMAMPHHQPMAVAGHCDDMPAPDERRPDRAAVDCMIACAVITQPDSPTVIATPNPAAPPARVSHAIFAGLHPEAEPPPPRFF